MLWYLIRFKFFFFISFSVCLDKRAIIIESLGFVVRNGEEKNWPKKKENEKKRDQNSSLTGKRWNKALTIFCYPMSADYCYFIDVKCYFFLVRLQKKYIHSLNLVHCIWVCVCFVYRCFLKVLKNFIYEWNDSSDEETNNNNNNELKKKKLNRAHFVRCIFRYDTIRYDTTIFLEKRRVYCEVILLVFCFIDFWLLDTASWCFDLRLIFFCRFFCLYSSN